MKSVKTYLMSLVFSILLVFLFSGITALIIADVNLSASQFKNIASDEKIEEKIYSGLERNYREKSNATGIPSSVYTEHLTAEYLKSVMNEYINAGFKAISSNEKFSPEIPKNVQLEESIDTFFNNYADETGYKKDENFNKKLDSTKEEAYKTIGTYSDAFKFSSVSSQGFISKISYVYTHMELFIAIIALSIAAIVLLLVFINKKYKKATLYWCGISALISGIIGAVPSIWLIVDRYYDSFSIKQPQVFTAYTSTFYRITEAFMAAHIAIAAIGITMLIVYCVLCGICKNNVKNPSAIDS